MAGHSKWAQIKRQKGTADQKRGAAFSKLANAISIAARQGADPAMNFQLRIAMDRAREANMPKDNIQRAIDKATGAGGQATLEEIPFEAYGPGGTAFLIEAATDNRNRTVGEVRATLNKFDAKLAEIGAVSYLFKKRGLIVLETSDREKAELAAIEAGADDFEAADEKVFVYCEPKDLESVRQQLETAGFSSHDITIQSEPMTTIPITDSALAKRVMNLSEALEELDDVTSVSSNFDVPENLLE